MHFIPTLKQSVSCTFKVSGLKFLCNVALCPWVEKIPWGRKWQPTPVFMPGKFHGQRSLLGYSLQGCKELNMTEWLSMHTLLD